MWASVLTLTRPQEKKASVSHHESHGLDKQAALMADTHHKHDKALDALGEAGRVDMTDEQSRAVCRKIDYHILPPLMW